DGDTGGAALTASESPSVDVASASLLGLLAMSTVMEAQVNEVCGPRATVSAMPIRVGDRFSGHTPENRVVDRRQASARSVAARALDCDADAQHGGDREVQALVGQAGNGEQVLAPLVGRLPNLVLHVLATRAGHVDRLTEQQRQLVT